MQVLIDRNKSLRVILTGSCARKLKRKGVNLLPGRIWHRNLHPLITQELGSDRILERVQRGSLPGVLDSSKYKEELLQYVNLYLEEEIRAEGLVRGFGNFSRFLTVAALSNTEQINYTNIVNDSQVKPNTVRSFFEILKDTLIGYELEPYRKAKKWKTVATSKFYFFDIGIVNALLNQFEIFPQTNLFGKALEHLIFCELKAFCDYKRPDLSLGYWRTQSKLEVDFILGDEIAIEVKSTGAVRSTDEKSLLALSEEVSLKRKIIVCMENAYRRTERGIEIIPVSEFLRSLWSGEV